MLEVLENKILAVDFDGTIVKDKFPEIGEPNWDVITWLKNCQLNGCKLILWTSRNNEARDYPGMLNKAVEFCKIFGLYFDAVNENLPEVKQKWGADTRKVLADYYIDDKAMLVNA